MHIVHTQVTSEHFGAEIVTNCFGFSLTNLRFFGDEKTNEVYVTKNVC